MLQNNPTEKQLASLVDDQGNIYRIQQTLGEGATAVVYKGQVVSSNSNQLQPGIEVAIKVPKAVATGDPDFDKEERARLQNEQVREQGNLAKVGDLVAIASPKKGEENNGNTLVQELIPGQMLTKVLYEATNNQILKKNLSEEMKDEVAYGLVREYAVLQMLNIVHCDLKPDNVMFDATTNSLKIMDFGNALNLANGEAHERIQAAGRDYLAPEAETANAKNNFKTDSYAIGVMIASLYTDKCYPQERVDRPDGQDAPSQIMEDVLGENVAHKEGMPEDLFKIARHLADPNPENRPQNVALAHGAAQSEKLANVHSTQVQADKLRQGQIEYIEKANAMPKVQPIGEAVLTILKNNRDLSVIRNQLAELNNQAGTSDATKQYINRTLPVLDTISNTLAKGLQKDRKEAVFNQYQQANVNNAGHALRVVKELETLASAHRSRQVKGILGFSTQYDSIGKEIVHTLDVIKSKSDYPKISPQDMEKTLVDLSSRIIESSKKAIEKSKNTISEIQKLNDSLPKTQQNHQSARVG